MFHNNLMYWVNGVVHNSFFVKLKNKENKTYQLHGLGYNNDGRIPTGDINNLN
jgi:hypothetical protein